MMFSQGCMRTGLKIWARSADPKVVQSGKEQEKETTPEGDDSLGDPLAEPFTAKHGQACADAVPNNCTQDDAERILVRCQGDGCDLRAVAPLREEGQHQRLQEGRRADPGK